ncbi:hypothetical protein RV11_GL002230 [Enterococcus phoeniculicola]|nr:hypothetical protein RV11_GL002230 [Enterococcus phoeniculicola]
MVINEVGDRNELGMTLLVVLSNRSLITQKFLETLKYLDT